MDTQRAAKHTPECRPQCGTSNDNAQDPARRTGRSNRSGVTPPGHVESGSQSKPSGQACVTLCERHPQRHGNTWGERRFFLEVIETLGDRIRVRNVPDDGKKPEIKTREAVIEREATRQLLRGKDVSREGAYPGRALLFFHDNEHTSRSLPPAEIEERFPRGVRVCRAVQRNTEDTKKVQRVRSHWRQLAWPLLDNGSGPGTTQSGSTRDSEPNDSSSRPQC